ncbi:MAG TPA: thioesterase family protein [Candidatus Sulfotelmatobacter sp.]|jgi:acyl-CoA thioesterase FadM|nr:thioesterase family protein [Candidatus Sulfotelmatobacter sp.]
MNLWLRVLAVIVSTFFRPRLAFDGPSMLSFRVWPHDLDINVHMNNARYMALMDLGRLDLIVRSGLWRTVFREGWQPVIAAALVRFKKPLKPFQPFTLTSRVISWDDRWIYIEHIIATDRAVACHAVVRGAFVRKGVVIPPQEVVSRTGGGVPSPLPDWVASWRDADRAFEIA